VEIIGHQKQQLFLRQMAQFHNLPHGFLFLGQEKLGKAKVALEFVKSINCANKNNQGQPCQNCSSCQSIERLMHPDLLIIRPKNKEIQIGQIRDLSRKLSLRPFQFFFKSAIIDDAHLMNADAQAALLKTLEEPSGNTVIILITGNPDMVSLAIRSRIQKIRFGRLGRSAIKDYLLSQGLAKEKVELITLISAGRPGVAIDLSASQDKLDREERLLSDLIKIISADSGLTYRFERAKSFSQQSKTSHQDNAILEEQQKEESDQSVQGRQLLEGWLVYLREFLLLKIGVGTSINLYPDVIKTLERCPFDKIIKIIQATQSALFLTTTTNTNSRLALEMIMLEM